MSDHDASDAAGDELDPEEPHTPLWFSLVGLAIFLLAAGYFAASSDASEPDEGSEPADTAEQEAPPPSPTEKLH